MSKTHIHITPHIRNDEGRRSIRNRIYDLIWDKILEIAGPEFDGHTEGEYDNGIKLIPRNGKGDTMQILVCFKKYEG